ncbi:MAG: type I-E CRISPR-associated protein Cse2/CasB [Pseudomonadota bacterium]|nr:type I-E CRISPR-associated protein Cse2/CasB [Pseudomonadota bacterium]
MSEINKYPFPQGRPDHPSFALLSSWWQRLENDKGERAVLRRAASLTEVMLSPAFHALLNDLRRASFGVPEYRYPKLAAIVGLAARIKTMATDGLATRMGTPKPGGSAPTFSELRLRRILACDDIEELYTLLRRALALLDEHANLADLAATVWYWSPLDDKRPYDPRRRLAYDYYAVAPIKA